MGEERDEIRRVALQALAGRGAHVLARDAFDGLAWEVAGRRPGERAHTVFELLNHLVYWHEFALAWIDGDKPVTPEHAALSWPGESAPRDAAEWFGGVERFLDGLAALEARVARLDPLAARGAKSVLEIVQLVASHNSYHLGQVAAARRVLGAWPPPGGGATW